MICDFYVASAVGLTLICTVVVVLLFLPLLFACRSLSLFLASICIHIYVVCIYTNTTPSD